MNLLRYSFSQSRVSIVPLVLLATCGMLCSGALWASASGHTVNLTTSWVGFVSLAIFGVAYTAVILEEQLHMRKSKPVLVAAGLIWAIIAYQYSSLAASTNDPSLLHVAENAVRHNLLEYAELFLFLLAAMTYINTMEERGVFNWLRVWLVTKGLSLRAIFWITGVLAFWISPVADNLTTALLMGTVAVSVGGSNKKFCAMALINIVVAANAGGAFSPFGDITTLMVWQKGVIPFSDFFTLLVPSLVNWLVPAAIMSVFLGQDKPAAVDEQAVIRRGGLTVVVMFLLTIIAAVSFHSVLHLPPVLGMMTGLGCLKLFGYYLKRSAKKRIAKKQSTSSGVKGTETSVKASIESDNVFEAIGHPDELDAETKYDIFQRLERAEWDTLMFFYGVILCVGGLGTIGYLELLSHLAYEQMGPTVANILVGILSAIVDNIPVMFAVLTMLPDMSEGQWLLVTLTAGVGGSLLSVGSAAGVALMGQARGLYTFGAHLKWTWAIALGYIASIATHVFMHSEMMDGPVLVIGKAAKAAAGH